MTNLVASPTGVHVDPVTFQVLASRLSGIVQEMQDNIFRTGYSTIVRESKDASCLLLDARGEVVGEHVVAPLHITALPAVARAILARYGDEIAPGDAFITNHPFEADITHAMDMAVATPFFVDGRLIGFCASIAHKSDLGGPVPGSANGSAREIFQEAILYPPIRLMRAGAVVSDVERIVVANSRTPELVMGDIRGQIGVARLGERRLAETVARYGVETLLAVYELKQAKTEERLRHELSAWPDGVAEAETAIDGDANSQAVRVHVRVEKRGDRISFDFRQTSDQTAMPINVRPAIVRGACYFSLMGLMDPTIENNGGLARVVETILRPGSLLDPHFPAPTNTYLPTATAVVEIVVAAMSKLNPNKMVADCGGVGALAISGRRADGTQFTSYELIGSAYGARSGKDGVSGITVMLSNSHTAPIEILENEFPLRLRRFALQADSGGVGRYRGGLGAVREYDILADGQVGLRGGKHAVPAQGSAGGGPAQLGALRLNPGTARETTHPSRFSGVPLAIGNVLRIEKSGGGGLGNPRERPFERVLADVLDGYVSRDIAITHYGVDAARLDAELAAWNAV